MTRKLHILLLLSMAAALPQLSGCVGAVAVGAGAGALMVSDRRPSETYLSDQGIEIRAANRIDERFGDKAHINVTSYNRAVLLTGEVPDAATKAEVEKITAAVPDVKAISNELEIAGISSLSSRSNDTYVTSKVKGRFLDANKFSVNAVKVVTENGVVYLLGIVSQREADAAVEVARTTGGVRKVVRLFEIVSEAQAKRLDDPANKPTQSGAPAAATPPPTPAKQ
ncbi:BON domain-containing protein [Sulfurisoma sediminicola]|uniref:Osmotically-inducible protein OsmY n=1 Tax=Sulfurisoma sediminicola TaxID=1381557 RepID=A0A497X8A5_9PROT|nr:BON domain-containing protein [Sulfurisoma sediminicola]RLJ62155.1 osmotically-inducible protein OsmY [Sulfurisoma sediminicola]